MRITEEIIKYGYFWLPSTPENKVPGILKITDGGEIKLELMGNFDRDLASAFTIDDNSDLKRIHGHIENNDFVTLDSCFYVKKKTELMGGISKSLIHVNQAFLGVLSEENEEITFNTFRFSVEGFDEWLSMKIKQDYDDSNKTASINCKPPEGESFFLKNGMQFKLTFSYSLQRETTEVKIVQKAHMTLISENLIPQSDFVSTANKIVNFFSFAIDKTVAIKDVIATSSDLQQEIRKGNYVPFPIKIYYPSIPFTQIPPKVQWNSMLFRFPEIRENVADILNQWLELYEIIQPSLNLYFASKTGAYKFLNGKFLSLAQGLETFHRRTSNETRMEENKYKELVAKILLGCPKEQKEWLEGRLKYGNEISLRKRIKKVIKPFEKHIGGGKEGNKIINSIVDTRNYFTHYDNSLENKAAYGQELWSLCMKMEAIFQLHLLKTLGFTDLQIDKIIEGSQGLLFKLDKTKDRKDDVIKTETNEGEIDVDKKHEG